MPETMGRRLVLFPFPFVGHQNPMFELGNILRSRGFSISVMHTRFHSPDTAKYPHFDFHFVDDGLPESEMSFDDIIAVTNILNKRVEPFRACLSRILSDDSDQEPVACIVTDAIWHFSQAVADGLDVPRIVLRTGNLSSFTVYTTRSDLKDKQPEDLIADRPPLRFEDMPRLFTGDQSPLHDLISDVAREMKACRGLIYNSFEEIEELSLAIMRQDFSIPIFPVGPFHKRLASPSSSSPAQDQGALSWLDTQAPNSVLYVSFGSLAAIDQAGFLEMAWGIANSNRPFLWVVRSDLVHSSDGSSHLPDEFLQKVSGRGHIVGWAPQKEVLAHPAVGGFWTHCGWNSTLESLCEGVPMICSPSFADQMVDTRYVTEVWEIGLHLEKGAKRGDVEKAISKLMAEKEGEAMRERAADLKNKATICLLPGGSSFKHMDDLVNLIRSF